MLFLTRRRKMLGRQVSQLLFKSVGKKGRPPFNNDKSTSTGDP